MNRIVCIYAYYEKDDIYRNNMTIFLETALRKDIDFWIVVNGESNVQFPENVVRVLRRENRGYDFGAWQYALRIMARDGVRDQYEYFVFVNSSVRYMRDGEFDWFRNFKDLFVDSPAAETAAPPQNEVELVGTTINMWSARFKFRKYNEEELRESFSRTLASHLRKLHERDDAEDLDISPPLTHVQSMFFVLNSRGLAKLLRAGFWSDDDDDNDDEIEKDLPWTIVHKEVMMSQILLRSGGNINCILDRYRGIDFTTARENINTTGCDPCRPGGYFGGTLNPTEVIFCKTNRGLLLVNEVSGSPDPIPPSPKTKLSADKKQPKSSTPTSLNKQIVRPNANFLMKMPLLVGKRKLL